MAIPHRPRLRPLEIVPADCDSSLFVLRDPEGIVEARLLPHAGALAASLMDGRRTLAEIRAAFKHRVGSEVSLADLRGLIRQLDDACLLEGERFQSLRRKRIGEYLESPVRAPAHAGVSYADDPEELRRQLDGCFTDPRGPGPIDSGWHVPERSERRGQPERTAATPFAPLRDVPPRSSANSNGHRVRGIISPHIDILRGGPAYAWAYKRLAEHCDADLFVVFGTSHNGMRQLFGATRKDFGTPLGTVRTDCRFLDRLADALAADPDGAPLDLFQDEPAHRFEHSIEFQAVFLRHVLESRRPFAVAPILVGSFQPWLSESRGPEGAAEVEAFLRAMRRTVEDYPAKVCYLAGADLAHIGRRFGDKHLLDDAHLAEQESDDRRLLAAVCRGDAAEFFHHVAACDDRRRICGLSPIYTLLRLLAPTSGELLTYAQATEPDRSSCVSFASLAFG